MIKHNRRIIYYIIAFVIFMFCCCGPLFATDLQNLVYDISPAKSVNNAALSVCSGSSISSASQYMSNKSGIHPIVIIIQSGEEYVGNEAVGLSTSQLLSQADSEPNSKVYPYPLSTGNYPSGVFPASVKDLQLVACIDQKYVSVESCDYFNGVNSFNVGRYQIALNINVFEANSRRLINTYTLYGSEPTNCPIQINNSQYNIVGGPVDITRFWEELRILYGT